MNKLIVLIPHYNNFQELLKSIASIDESIQIDILIVDDGSKRDIIDEEKIIDCYKGKGTVFIEVLKTNQGIEYALNHGLRIIKNKGYKYVGRLDCGDFCHKGKFKTQLDYLEDNQDVYLLGTWANIKSMDGEMLYVLKHPCSYEDIKKKMYINSRFVHPSVVFRVEVIDKVGYYPTNFKAAEDFAYFFKIMNHFKVENLPVALLDYIVDDNSISSTKRKLQVKNRIRVILENFKWSKYPIIGLIRNSVLLFTSRKMTTFIKKLIQ